MGNPSWLGGVACVIVLVVEALHHEMRHLRADALVVEELLEDQVVDVLHLEVAVRTTSSLPSSKSSKLLTIACDCKPSASPISATFSISCWTGPFSTELDDVFSHRQRGVTIAAWRDSIVATVRELGQSSANGTRLIVLNLHPYIVGQPFRIRYLEDVLADLISNGHVCLATLGEIVDSYLMRNGTA
jgi:hypothetical protein